MQSLHSMKTGLKSKRDPWNRCDVCGRFISYADFDKGATNIMVTPDSDYTSETYETMCVKCNRKEEFEAISRLQSSILEHKVIRFKDRG